MTHRLFHIVGEYGLVIVFVNVLVDQLGMPVPAVPTLVVAGAIAAGGELPLASLGWLRFLGLSAAGALLWVGSALLAGMLFKLQIEAYLARLDRFGGLAASGIAAALALYVGYKWLQRQRFYRSLRMARIDVDALYALIQSGARPIIVDVRSPTARVARVLMNHGFNKVRPLHGGLDAWVGAGYAVEGAGDTQPRGSSTT